MRQQEEVPVRRLDPEFFGFNLEWVDFQQSLWDSANQTARAEVVGWLKPFSGAVYRYPGGTESNHFDWREGVGEPNRRPIRQRVDWLGPIRVEFGFDEYLGFVKAVGGQAWAVANIHGRSSGEITASALADSAGEWSTYAKARATGGMPHVLRWELGNELDRGDMRWPAAKYASVATLVANAISRTDPDAKFVGMLQDWPAQAPLTVSAFNSAVMSRLSGLTSGYAHHLYYEGLPRETVEQRGAVICRSIEDAHAAGVESPEFWITEHARNLPGPQGAPDWKRNWPKTADLEATLLVAEAYILATQIPEARGMFLHSLGTTRGPWPLFNVGEGNTIHPSAVYWGIRILRDSMLPYALSTLTESRNDGRSNGGHDIRGAILTDQTRSRYTVWLTNRSSSTASVRLQIPRLARRNVAAGATYVADSDELANNYSPKDRISPVKTSPLVSFDATGSASLQVPAHSVSAFKLSSQ